MTWEKAICLFSAEERLVVLCFIHPWISVTLVNRAIGMIQLDVLNASHYLLQDQETGVAANTSTVYRDVLTGSRERLKNLLPHQKI